MRNGKHYLVALNTHVFPTRRGDDVGLAGGWVDAFLAEGEHARACLFIFQNRFSEGTKYLFISSHLLLMLDVRRRLGRVRGWV